MTTLELESKAVDDYKKALGTVITVTTLSGYNEHDDCIAVDGIPFEVRVLDTPESDLRHWVDEYLDPYWNVEPVKEYAELNPLRSFWTYGPSYVLAREARA